MITCAKYGFLRHQDDRRCDAFRQLSNIFSNGIPWFIFAQRRFLSACRDARLRFSGISSGVPRLSYAKYAFFRPFRDGLSRDAWRHFSSVVSSVIRKLTCTKPEVYGVAMRCSDAWRPISEVVSTCNRVSFVPKWRSVSASWGMASRRWTKFLLHVSWHPRDFLCQNVSVVASRRYASRRCRRFYFLSNEIFWVTCDNYGVSGCFATLGVGFVSNDIPRLTCDTAPFCDVATYGVVTRGDLAPGVIFLCVRWRPDVPMWQICRTVPSSGWMASRSSTSVFQCYVQ
jgi:hypothetical protein